MTISPVNKNILYWPLFAVWGASNKWTVSFEAPPRDSEGQWQESAATETQTQNHSYLHKVIPIILDDIGQFYMFALAVNKTVSFQQMLWV